MLIRCCGNVLCSSSWKSPAKFNISSQWVIFVDLESLQLSRFKNRWNESYRLLNVFKREDAHSLTPPHEIWLRWVSVIWNKRTFLSRFGMFLTFLSTAWCMQSFITRRIGGVYMKSHDVRVCVCVHLCNYRWGPVWVFDHGSMDKESKLRTFSHLLRPL